MIFGLFKTKSQRLLELTEESLREADIFVGIIKEKIGEEIILWMNRCENKDVNSLKDIGKEAMEERQSEITVMGENNPNWVRACIVESYVSAKIFGKPKSGIDEVILQIVSWIEMNAPKAYKKHFNNRSIDSFLE
jgi:hypothetical protein